MHLPKPIILVNDEGQERKAFYTSELRDYEATGFYPKPRERKVPFSKPAKVEAPVDKASTAPEPAPERLEAEVVVEAEEGGPEPSFDFMTKTELLDWALRRGHDLPNNNLKAELVRDCKAILEGTFEG